MQNPEIKQIISKKVVTFKKEAKVKDIAKKMSQNNISCVIIIEGKKPIGVITERDMIKKVICNKGDPDKLMAVEVMSFPLVTVTEDVGLIAVAQLMKKKGIRRVVVVKGGALVGIITQSDILEGMINKIKHLNWQLVHTEISLDEYIDSLKKIQLETIAGKKD